MGTATTWAIVGATSALLTAACSETADFTPDNRGEDTETPLTSVDNAYIVPAHMPGNCAVQVGSDAELRFTATNGRSTGSESLLSITTDAANAVRIPAEGAVDIGPKSSQEIVAAVQGLREEVRPAMSVEVTFRFDQSGDIEMRVPVEACPTQQT